MLVRGLVRTVAKAGNQPSENEDAAFPIEFTTLIEPPFYCAVSDGATESSFSASWARLLVQHYTKLEGELGDLDHQLPMIRTTWHQEATSQPLPWYAEQKLHKGAFATLLGLSLQPGDVAGSARWHAVAIGDSCIFVRHGGDVQAFPIEQSADLTRAPHLVSSRSDDQDSLQDLAREAKGAVEVGDCIALVTDAVAGWMLSLIERGEDPFEVLLPCLGQQESFEKLIADLRAARAMKNDDCTVMLLSAVEPQPPDAVAPSSRL